MFGFISIDPNKLTQEQVLRYKSIYCGLCRSLRDRHGAMARMTLTYDMTFLVLVLCSLYEPNEIGGEETCPAHPIKKRTYVQSEISDYAADMNIALAYHNCIDDWKDDLDVAALAGSGLMKASYERVCRQYPRQCNAIEQCLAELNEIEKRRDDEPDAAAGSFGKLMAELFVMREDFWSDRLRRFGMALGQFIYVMDACIDLKNDKRYYKYNPFVKLYGRLDEEERFRDILQMLLADCISEFEALPMLQDADIIRNVLCFGVWAKFNRHYGIKEIQ